PGRHRFGTTHSHLSDRGIGQEFDVPDALLQLVEHHVSALEKGACVDRRLDAAGTAIKKTDTQSSLQPRNRLRYRRLRHSKMSCAFGHAAPLHDSGENVQITQLDAPPKAALPLQDRLDHWVCLYR